MKKQLYIFILLLAISATFYKCSTSKINTSLQIEKEKNKKMADSLYMLAWKMHNNKQYVKAGELFEKSIEKGYSWSGAYLNAASSWANANNKTKTFENLNKLIDANYLDKEFIIENFPEFYKYYKSDEWKKFIVRLDEKRNKYEAIFRKTKLKKLSKQEMYQDFDTLVSTIKQVSPHLRVREKVCSVNYDSLFSKFRNEIEFCKSNSDFAILVKRTLISCQDGHTSISSLNPWDCIADGNNLSKCASIGKYQQLYNSVKITSENLPRLVYHEGKYYTAKDYHYKNFYIPQKTQLSKINGLLPKDYILKNIDRKRSLSWDFKTNNFYSEYFLQQNIASDSIVNLTFLLNSKPISFQVHLKVGYKKKEVTKPKDGFVWYWKNKELLYIRMPEMSNGEFYHKEIMKYSDKRIKIIVIDIRDNPGGGDGSWYYLLNTIMDVNINLDIELATNPMYADSSSVMKKIGDIVFHKKQFNKKIPNAPFSSLNYTGNVYVLFNNYTFSSAGSLVNTCYYDEQLIAVGEKTGKILGFGVNPKKFILLNSKLKYRIEPVIDITNSSNYQDIFHDRPEIDVHLNLDEKILLRDNPYTVKFMKEKDPYFKRILK